MAARGWIAGALVAVVAVVVVGCGKKADEEQKPAEPVVAEQPGAKVPTAKPAWSDDARRVVSALPPGIAAVVIIDLPQPVWAYLTTGTMVPLSATRRAELDKELSGFLGDRLGVDIREVRSAAAFVTPDKQFAAIVPGVGGELRGGPRLVLDKDPEIVAVLTSRFLVVGTGPAVDAAASSIGGKGNLAKAEPELARWIEAELDGSFIGVAARLPAMEKLADEKAPPGLELGAASVSRRGIYGALTGDPNTLKMIAAQMEMIEAQAMRELTELRTQSTAPGESTALGALAIAQYHTAASLFDAIETKVDGKRLSVGAPLAFGLEPTMLVALVGIGAAVAVPAFMKYTRKSKATEGQALVSSLSQAVQRYHAANGAMPPPTGVTPALGSCCAQPDGMCAPTAALWAAESWAKLEFKLDEPHRYSVEVATRPDGYTARAIGDLDCDGNYSTFEIEGKLAGGQLTAGPVSPVNELE